MNRLDDDWLRLQMGRAESQIWDCVLSLFVVIGYFNLFHVISSTGWRCMLLPTRPRISYHNAPSAMDPRRWGRSARKSNKVSTTRLPHVTF